MMRLASCGACDISDFGDGLVVLDLQLGELGGGGVLAHDAICCLQHSSEGNLVDCFDR
jgi:hypothetical protein